MAPSQKAALKSAAPATAAPVSAPLPPAAKPPREMRGVWIATVTNIDWPSSRALSAAEQKKEITAMLDELKKLGFNTVIFQVRPAADTCWPSKFEPWSRYISGAEGKSPGYDVLAFIINETHKRDMEFHAWFNPFRVTVSAQEKLSSGHPAAKNKDWAVTYDGKMYYDPGNPLARRHVIRVISEVVSAYDIDAVHLDDYFYPYPVYKNKQKVPFPDGTSFAVFGKKGQKVDDWRRENVNAFVRELRKEIKAIKPGVELGISPFGIWRNQKEDAGGSPTNGFSSYSGLYADSQLWLKEGLLDYIAPQLYWDFCHKTAPYGVLTDWWAEEVHRAGNGTRLYIGLAAYKHGEEWKDKTQIKKQVDYARKKGADGFLYFSAIRIMNDKADLKKVIKECHQ